MKAKRTDFDPALFRGIAHRGLHDNKGVTENGKRAFELALEHGLAMELDIHLTKDGELVVIHDSELERVTGKKGIVEELTLEELRRDYRLRDGETIPTYQEILDLVQERLPIVTELKVYENNYHPLAKKAISVLKQIKDKKKITLISFDPRALVCCGGRGFTRGLLICKEHQWVFRTRAIFDYLDVEDCLTVQPEYGKYRAHGGLINTWTIDTEAKVAEVKGHADMFTFQYLPLETIRGLCE